MGRPKLPPNRRKQKISITPAPEVLEYIDARVGLGKPYKDRTHAFEAAVASLMRLEGIEPALEKQSSRSAK